MALPLHRFVRGFEDGFYLVIDEKVEVLFVKLIEVYVFEHAEELRFDVRVEACHHGGCYGAYLYSSVGVYDLIGTEETVAFADTGHTSVGQE